MRPFRRKQRINRGNWVGGASVQCKLNASLRLAVFQWCLWRHVSAKSFSLAAPLGFTGCLGEGGGEGRV